MENATSQIAIFPSKKEEISAFVSKVLTEIDEGLYNPLDIYVRLNALNKATDLIKEKIREMALNEFAKHGSKTVDIYGAEIQQIEAGHKFDYANCGDPQYDGIINQCRELEIRKKERESFLKSIPGSGIELTDENTGEISKVYPPAKSSTTTLKIILK